MTDESSARIDEQAREIVSALTMDQKIELLSGSDEWHIGAIPSTDIGETLLTDGPHGVRKSLPRAADGVFGITVPSTCFPTAVTLAATWDVELLEEVGRALGDEALAEGVSVLLGPGLNLKRHPNGGRNFEYFSEDPVVSGKLAAAMVRGIQSRGVAACLKHFAANNQETARFIVNTIIDERTLRELYLTGFEIAVKESNPRTVMSAYNRINGEYCGDSRRLLTEILRDEWGFDGLVMSDWGATNHRPDSIHAGQELEMPSSGGAHDGAVAGAVASGELAVEDLDLTAARIIRLALEGADAAGSHASYDADRHHALARRAAAAGTVLLDNNGILPLDGLSSVAVVGAFAEHPRFQGAGSSGVKETRLDDALSSFRDALGTDSVGYAAGYDVRTGETTQSLLDQASGVAGLADVAVVFIGYPAAVESEGFDRDMMQLLPSHLDLVDHVVAANPNTVVVLTNGSAVEIPWIVGSPSNPKAIVEAFLGGQAGGSAIVDVLLGAVEPGGRLTETFPLRQSDVPSDGNFGSSNRSVEYREALNVGYRYFDTYGVAVRYPFGHGLGYTTFDYGDAVLSSPKAEAGDLVTVTVEVTNTGRRRGSEIVQVYVGDVESSVPRPAKELKGFAKVELEPGETRSISVDLDERAFAFYDVASAGWQVESGDFDILIGASSADIRTVARVSVSSDFVPRSEPDREPILDDEGFAALFPEGIPVTEDVRPFHRNSTLTEVQQVRLGRVVNRLLDSMMSRMFGDGDADVDGMRLMMERMMVDAPLRTLVGFSEGRLSFKALDTLIDGLNGRWLSAIGRPFRRADSGS